MIPVENQVQQNQDQHRVQKYEQCHQYSTLEVVSILPQTRVKRNIVWKFFKKDTANANIAYCTLCKDHEGLLCSGNTSNCMDDLKRFHTRELRSSSCVPCDDCAAKIDTSSTCSTSDKQEGKEKDNDTKEKSDVK